MGFSIETTRPTSSLLARGWLSTTDQDFARSVVERSRLVHFRAGDTVYSIDQHASGLFGLVKGGAKVEIASEQVGPLTAHYMQPGAWFGGRTLVRDSRSMGLIPTRKSTFAFLGEREISALAEMRQGWWREFMKLVLQNSQTAIGTGLDLMIRDPRRRLAATLLRLGGLRHSVNLASSNPEIDLSQSEIAQMANLARNSASKFLHEFGDLGLVEWNYRCIRILSPSGLEAFADRD
jgi:CRP/FNR family transcriptional regulator, cyclic AMP receptor protein